MIQEVAFRRALPLSRRAAALLLAVLLNLAIVPCTMAIEVEEEGHDCCPPELKYEPRECCELGDVNIDSRSAFQKYDVTPDFDFAVAGSLTSVAAFSPAVFIASSDPPDPPGQSVALHKRHCVYLK